LLANKNKQTEKREVEMLRTAVFAHSQTRADVLFRTARAARGVPQDTRAPPSVMSTLVLLSLQWRLAGCLFELFIQKNKEK